MVNLLKVLPLIVNYKKSLSKYQASMSNPFKIIYVNPNDINFLTVPRFLSEYSSFGYHVVDGKWDEEIFPEIIYISTKKDGIEEVPNKPQILPFNKYKMYSSMQAHFINHVPWEKTEIYEWLLYKIKKGEDTPDRLSNPEEITTRLEQLDSLYQSIKIKGFRKTLEYNLKSNSINSYLNNIKKSILGKEDNILVNIGRDGRIILDDGRHRLMMAKILGIELIPVRVLVRHKKWQSNRMEYLERRLKGISSIQTHPDLQDINKMLESFSD